MSRSTTLLCAACLTLAGLSTAMAQGGGGGGKGGRGGGPGGGRGMDAAMLGGQAGGNQFNQPNLNQANIAIAQVMQNQNQNQQNMPTVAQLAATLMTTYDTDGNGALDVAELQAALTGLRSMMLANNQHNQQNGMAGMNAAANADNQLARPPRRR